MTPGNSELSPFSIQRMPDVAKEVGFLIMITANLDSWILPALAHLLRGKVAVAIAIVSRVDSVSAKFEVMVDIAKEREGTPMGDAVLEHQSKVREALQFRNKLAHGMFGFDLEGKPINTPFPFSMKRGRPKAFPISPELIRPHTDGIGAFIEAIAKLSGQAYLGIPSAGPS